MQIFVKTLTRKTIPISEFIVHCLTTISVTCITQWRYADFCEDPYRKDYSLFGNLSTLPDYNIRDLHHSVMICRSLWRPSWEGPFSFWESFYSVWLSVTYITQWWCADLCEDPHKKGYSHFGIHCTLSDYNICNLHHSVMVCKFLWRPSWEGLFLFWESLYLGYLVMVCRFSWLMLEIIVLLLTTISVPCIT